MLRVKDLVPGKPTTTIASYAIAGGVVALALATAFCAAPWPRTTARKPPRPLSQRRRGRRPKRTHQRPPLAHRPLNRRYSVVRISIRQQSASGIRAVSSFASAIYFAIARFNRMSMRSTRG